MRRLAAVAIVALLVTLAPVAVLAAHSQEVVAVQHTDFGTGGESAPATLDTMFVDGSGDSAEVRLGSDVAYNPASDEGDGLTNGGESFVGDFSDDTPTQVETRIQPSTTGTITGLRPNIFATQGSDYGFTVDIRIVEETPDGTTGDGTLVRQDWDPDFATGFQSIDIQPYAVEAGTDYTVEWISSGTDNDGTVDQLNIRFNDDATETWIWSSVGGFRDRYHHVSVNITTTGGVDSGTYVSDNVSLDDATTAKANVSEISNADAIVTVDEFSSGSWSQVTQSTFTTAANHSLDISGATATKLRMNVTVVNQTGNGAPSFTLGDDSWLFDADAPTVDDGSASPTGDISSAGPTLSIDVEDADFPLAQGDSVTAEFFVDGSSIGTDTLTSDGTASVSAAGLTGGSHTWNVTVTDDYGLSHQSDDFTINVPDEVRILNETDPGTLVQSPTTVTIQFFAEDGTVVERTTTNGIVDMTGLPAEQSFVVDASAPNYNDRRIYVESLYEQQEIYLLNTSVTSADVVFSLDDESNQFSPIDESALFVEKPLTIGGSTSYQVITSDQFSATNEMPVTLQQDQRYRLRLLSPSGDTRVLGAYRATGDDQATLTVGEVTFEGGNATNPAFQATVQEIDGNRFVRLIYDDPANATTDLSLEVQNRTSGAFLRPNTTESGPFGRYVETIPISATKDDISYNVSYHADRDGFDDDGGTLLIGDVPQIATQFGLDVGVLSMLGYLTVLGVLGITCIAYPRYAGIPTTAIAAFVVAIGVVDIHPLLIGGMGVVALIFAVGGGR